MKQKILHPGNKSGFTLLELIVVLTIIGSMSLLIAPSFSISENTAEHNFAPFREFIEKNRNNVILSGNPAILGLDAEGIMKISSLEKDKEGKTVVIDEISTINAFSFKVSSGNTSKGSVLLMPNGTMDSLIIELPEQQKKLLYNGTAARGRLL